MKASRKHIFLTGNIQVGKSTLLKAVIDNCPKKNIGGFFTRWINKADVSHAGLYIFPCEPKAINEFWDAVQLESAYSSSLLSSENLIASFESSNYKSKIVHGEVFDKLGKKYLKQAQKSDLVIIDEIGILEDKSYQFKDELCSLLDDGPEILGIVRNKSGLLTDMIRNHPNVDVIEVTKKNRDELRATLLKHFK